VSLNGNLEDLPLLDILQIIAFSQKTGFLTVQTLQGEAALVFREGLIVSSFTWDSQPLDARSAALPEGERAVLIREAIEIALERLSRLRDGAFCFELTKDPPTVIGPHDLSRETLTRGINPQELLLELAQGIDEDRRDSVAAVESAFATPEPEVLERVSAQAPGPPEDEEVMVIDVDDEGRPRDGAPVVSAVAGPPAPAAPPASREAAEAAQAADERHRLLLLLEDEEDVRAVLAGAFMRAGYQVVEAEDPLSAVRKARGLADMGLPFVLVADRGMPTSDSASFDGGLEAVKRVQLAGLHPPILLMTDRMTRGFHARVRKLGVTNFVFKPGVSRLDPRQFEADLLAFAARVIEGVLPGLEEIAEAPVGPAVSVALPRQLDNWDEVAALQRRLEELHGPRDAFQVSTLIMKVAREFFERAVLFVVKDETLRGLTGFGPAVGDEISLLARELIIPLGVPSVFEQVVASGESVVGPLPEKAWAQIESTLGRFQSQSVALLPLVTHRETIALVLGDNPETGAELRSVETLSVFLNQAGLALENAFLERKLKARLREDRPSRPAADGSGAGSLLAFHDLDDLGPDSGPTRPALGPRLA
jgi:CheY-like chemotaxis protein